MNKSIELTYLGIDYGTTNIGLALGRNKLADPLKTISGKNTEIAIREIVRISLENKVDKYIVGLPLTAENKETKQSLDTRKFAKLLKIYSRKPVIFVNEFASTQEAGEQTGLYHFSQRTLKKTDHYSAAIILHHFFEQE